MKFLILFAFIAFIGISFAQQCGNNEEWNDCGTACPTTCENMKQGPIACIKMCKTGCFCKSPYIRSELSGQCVLTRDCGV